MPLAPTTFARQVLPRLIARWNGPERALRDTIHRFQPQLAHFHDVPLTALLALTANATSSREEQSVLGLFYRIGYFQTEAGPIPSPQVPNPDRSAPYNDWGFLHNHPTVVSLLGRNATMNPDEWPSAIADQTVIGLVNFDQKLAWLQNLISSGPGVLHWSSQWAYALALLAYELSPPDAATAVLRYARIFTPVDENARLGVLIDALVQDGRAITEEAFAWLRVLQILSAGQALSEHFQLTQDEGFYNVFRRPTHYPVEETIGRLIFLASRPPTLLSDTIQKNLTEQSSASTTPKAARTRSTPFGWLGAGTALIAGAWLLFKK